MKQLLLRLVVTDCIQFLVSHLLIRSVTEVTV